MTEKIMDVRLSEDGAKAYNVLAYHIDKRKSKRILDFVLSVGIRPDKTKYKPPKGDHQRMRFLIDESLHDDIKCVARADNVSVETYIDALFRTASETIQRKKP